MGEFSYVIKDYKVQTLKEKGHGDVYYKDNPDVKVLVIYTLPSGPWLSTLPSMDFLTRLGNASGSGYNRIDKTLFVNLSGDPNAKSWSGTQPTDSTGMMLNLDTTTTYWTEQKKTDSAKRYQTSLF